MRSKLPFVFVILALVFSAPASVIPAAAQNQQPEQLKTSPVAGSAGEYLLLLAVPELHPEQMPIKMGFEEAKVYTEQMARIQAELLLPELMRHVKEGRIASFEIQPDRTGIKITLNDPGVLTDLRQLKGIEGVFPAEKAAICSQDAAKNVAKLVSYLSYGQAQSSLAPAAVASDPALSVYHQPATNWGYVNVKTTANTVLSMEIWHNGSRTGTATGTSYSDGSYTFYSGQGSCSNSTSWEIYSGDTVKVTAHGSTTTMIISNLVVMVDPTANVVSGVTAGTSMVNITLYTANADGCSYSPTAMSVGSGGDGKYSLSFNDFDRRAYAIVSVPDLNGNSTLWQAGAFGFDAYPDTIYFNWRTDESFTLTITRGGNLFETWYYNPWQASNYYLQYGTNDYQTGDVITVISTTYGSMSYTIVPLSMNMNPATDQITGTTGLNKVVVASIGRYYNSTCTTSALCIKATSNGTNGAFTITTPLGQGDQASVKVNDAEGNAQYGPNAQTPVIVAYPLNSEAYGTWPNTNPLTVTLKNSGGVVKDTRTDVNVSSYGDFLVYFSGSMAAGDKVEVTDGVTTASMTVQNLTSRLSTSQAKLIGTASSSHLTVYMYDRRGLASGTSYCQEQQVNGSFTTSFSGSQIGPWDYANVYQTGLDGHFTRSYVHTFSVYFYMQFTWVGGYTETPAAGVTATWKRGANTLGAESYTSDGDGWFGIGFSGTEVFQPGDVIQVSTGDGNSATLTAPTLTVNMDAPGNRLYGNAPANQPVEGILYMTNSLYSSTGQGGMGTANASGNYSISTLGWRTYDCVPLQPGGQCVWAYAYTYLPSGHEVDVESNSPEGVAADSYEADNTWNSAYPYAGIQHRTFDDTNDVDWVKFTVSQTDVNRAVQYVFKTYNLGPYMDTVLELYGTDGTTMLASNDDNGNSFASQIIWTPPAAGTYYLKARPISSSKTVYCGAFYDLLVQAQRTHLFVPALFK